MKAKHRKLGHPKQVVFEFLRKVILGIIIRTLKKVT